MPPGCVAPALMAWFEGLKRKVFEMPKSLTRCFLELNVSLHIWAAVQSLASIVCCCAPVYRPLFKNGFWSRNVPKVGTHSIPVSLEGKREKSPVTETDSRQTGSLDSYSRDKVSFHTDDYTGITRSLATDDATGHASQGNRSPPMGSIQADRRVEIDYRALYQTHLILSPPEPVAPRVGLDYSCLKNAGEAA